MENETDIILGTSKETFPCIENIWTVTQRQNNDEIKYKEKKGSNTINRESETDVCISSEDDTNTIQKVEDLDFVDKIKTGNNEHIVSENEGKAEEKICMYIQTNVASHGISSEEGTTTSHKQEDKSFHCNQCNKKCRSLKSLNNHRKIHTAGKIYSCSLCGEIFPKNYLLKEHMITHNAKCECVVCGKSFNQQIKLKRHMSIHKRNKSHICSMCNKAFSDKRSKERHMLIACPKLPKNNSVVQHFKTHKGIWPYAYLYKKGNENKTKQFIDKDFQLHTTDQTFCTSIKDEDMIIKDSENACSALSDEELHSEDWQVVGFTTHDSEMITDDTVSDHFKLKDTKTQNNESDVLVQTNEEMYTKEPEPVSSVSTKDETAVAKDLKSDNEMKKITETYDKDSISSIPTKTDTCTTINNKTFTTDCRIEGMDIKESSCPNEMMNQAEKEIEISSEQDDSSSEKDLEHMNEDPISKHLSRKTKETQNCLKNQMQRHSSEKPYTCNTCGVVFTNKRKFDTHMRTHLNRMKYTCDFCSKQVSRIDVFKRHMRTHADLHGVTCTTSDYLEPKDIEAHDKKSDLVMQTTEEVHTGTNEQEPVSSPRKKETVAKDYQSEFNTKTIIKLDDKDSKSLVRTRRNTKYNNKNLTADGNTEYLNKDPSSYSSIKKKKGTQNMKSTSPCQAKNGEMNTPLLGNKESQKSTNNVNKPYVCNLCSKGFSRTDTLRVHIKSHSGQKPFLCSFCGKTFLSNQHLGVHLLSHSDEKPFKCSTCGKRFKASNRMKVHMRQHSGETPYLCITCGESFSYRRHLQEHMTEHTGKKPHSCSTCGKGFIENCELQAHMRTHSGERPHSCTICGSAFADKRNLNRHVKRHIEGMKYTCNVCGKKVSRVDALNRHMRKHTDLREKSNMCKLCGKGFYMNQHLINHMKTHA
ncbi:zinc finger protein 585A-like [Mytilus trossulus]|uniref:zinc finger protein 585A-like n=1 Tax=Mytilus trossulus TaxID=6551 RepID=UPI0030074416